MSGAITINTKGGLPTVSLNDGGTATYDAAASSSGTLVFDYTVGKTDQTPSLQVTQVNLNGAIIDDANGNAADLSAASTFATNLQVGPSTGLLSVFDDATGSVVSNQYDLGTITLNQTAQAVLDIQNFGTANLVLNSVSLTTSSNSISLGSIAPGTVIAP